MKLPEQNKQQGSAIVVVLSVTVTVAMIVAVAMEYTTTIRRNVQRSQGMQSAIAIGDGALESAFASWRTICRQQTNAARSTTDFQSIPLPTQAQFPTVAGFTAIRGSSDLTLPHAPTVSDFQIIAVDPQLNPMDATVAPIPGIGQSPNTSTWYYLAQADVTVPVLRSNVTSKVRRVFQKEQLSPWNWAIFYVDSLEIQPGASMDITGWVHTNGNLYTGHNLLHFGSKVTYGSDWAVGFAPGDPRSPGGSNPETPTTPTYLGRLPPAYDIAHQPFGLDSTLLFSTTDTNPNNDSYHELLEQKVAGYTDPLVDSNGNSERYYDQAAIKILIDSSSNLTIKKLDGTSVTSSSTGDNLKLYNAINGAITKNQSIQDNREAASVRLTTLDIGAIVGSLNSAVTNSSHIFSNQWNGVIYITDTSASSSVRRGIRLKNGAILPANGITIASANPVYIQGDYNTGTGTVPSNSTTSNDPTTPQSSGYTRKPASVVADAVNILSNNWNDANAESGDPLSARVASNTTVNSAIVSGIVPSANNHYSGGAENFPRFLESWSNKIFTYYGSMVQLYKSRQAVGIWGSDNVYDAPIRHWYFDTNLQINTPPGSLLVYSYVKGRWFLAN